MKNNTKNKILFTSILVMLILSYPFKHKYKKNYNILDDDAFASYSGGLIYIGNSEYINNLENINDGDILVIDERNSSDPEMIICDSYNIKDKDIRNDVLEVLCIYEEMHPSKWNRSIESMRFEWLCHNIAYYFNYRVKDSRDVDLNNGDEEKYKHKILNRFFRI